MNPFGSRFSLKAFTFAAVLAHSAHGATVATYLFNNSFLAEQAGVTALTPVDPMGTSGFSTDTVFGHSRTVYHFNGATTSTDEGGLTLDTTGLISSNLYSVEMVFKFDSGNNAWRRILDALNRTSDNGFYVGATNHLEIFPVAASSTTFNTGTYYDVFLTVDGSDHAKGYLNGSPQPAGTTTSLNIATNFLNFFLDNTSGSALDEWSSGSVALVRLYDTKLSDSEIADIASDPFGTTVPEPATWGLMLTGAALVFARKFRR